MGTSTDAPAGIASLQIAISSNGGTGNSWWNGTSFSAGSAVYFDTTTYGVGATIDTWSWNRPFSVKNAQLPNMAGSS